jgi:two-component system, LuxR family, sensor kinase FixL
LTMGILVFLMARSIFSYLVQAKKDQESLSNTIFDTAVDGIVLLSARNKVHAFNKGAEKIFGYESHEMLGHGLNRLMGEEHNNKHEKYVANYQDSGDAKIIGSGRVVRAKRKSGEEFDMYLAVSEFKKGEETFYAGFCRDISQEMEMQKALEKSKAELLLLNKKLREEHVKLVQAEKLSSIGLLASGVAHEINNPLAGVMACVDSLSAKSLSQESEKEYFEMAQAALNRIKSTVQDLLGFARQGEFRLQEIDVRGVLDGSVHMLRPIIERKKIQLNFHDGNESDLVLIDKSQVTQALMNIILNAIQAVDVNGIVDIFIRSEQDRIFITVIDDGPGIPPEIISRIKDTFFSTKNEGEGTGLGLSVTEGILKNHGSDLEISSVQGKGTEVVLSLPNANIN